MRREIFFIFFFLLSFCCNCSPSLSRQQYAFQFSTDEIQTITIEAQKMFITVIPSPDTWLHVSYDDFTEEDEKRIAVSTENHALIISGQRNAQTENGIIISVPSGIEVEINAFHADFSLQNLSGNISVRTVDGDMVAENMQGITLLRTARGNITISDSQGDISVLGEHGVLTLDSLHGDIDSSTVVGSIQFSGQVLADDDIFLESDHGSVTATLTDSENAFINLWSANGTVTCMLTGVEMTNITCQREPEVRVGSFQIKTVWGRIIVNSD